MNIENLEPTEGVLTERMDVGTKGFFDFQAILLQKARSRTVEQQQRLELLSLKYQMEDYVYSNSKEEKTAGEFLKTILKTLAVKQNKFAEYIGIKPSNLSKLISGERSINADLAIVFGRTFGHDPMLWIEIQAKNELQKLSSIHKEKYNGYSLSGLMGA